MSKRSQECHLSHGRGQAGCMWSLISIFDFRSGRTTKQLLSDRSRANKQIFGDECSSSQAVTPSPSGKCESIVDVKESEMPLPDAAKTSVKELMEEEMFDEQGSEKHNDSKTGLNQSNSNNGKHLKKRQKKRSRSHIKSSDLDVAELATVEQLMPENYNQVPEQRILDNIDLEMIMEELVQINQRNPNGLKNDDLHGDLELPSGQAVAVVEQKLFAAVKLLMEQRLRCSKRFGEDGSRYYSTEFMDALKTLSSNEGVLLKLLQDPTSKLVKHVRSLEDAQLETNSLPIDDKPRILKTDESSSRKHLNFFRRRTKSMNSFPLGGEKDFQSPNTIVILKPGQGGGKSPQTDSIVGSLHLQSPNTDDKVRTDRNTSQFSFTEIKRKLRHAIGKEKHGLSPDRLDLKYSPKNQNGSNGDGFGWSSPNRNHFYTERFLTSSPGFKKGEAVGKLKESGSVSNLYVEAKKHLSEMLKSGGENPEAAARQLPKSLERILSLPEYNGSPCCSSPRKYGDDIFMTAQIRLSPRGIVKNDLSGLLQENHSNHPSPRKQHLESQPGISSSKSEDKILNTNDDTSLGDDQERSVEIESVTEDALVPEVQSSPAIVAEIDETAESEPPEEEKMITSSSGSTSDLIGGDMDKEDINEEDNEQVSSQCFDSPTVDEDRLLSSPAESPPRCLISNDIEYPDYAIDKVERPSPISVLEPLFTDDDISPASSISRAVKKEIQPRRIHFEEQTSPTDQGICTRILLEDEESAFEYVEAVLLGSGLNWDEFLLRWISTYDILDSLLFEEVELFSSRPHHDQKLLFDCSNDALRDVCETYYGCLLVKMNVKPAPVGMDLIHEIWQRVKWHMFQLPHPHSLEQLVRADLARSTKWMNLQSDFELIVSEMGDIIFSEMVDEIVLSFDDEFGAVLQI